MVLSEKPSGFGGMGRRTGNGVVDFILSAIVSVFIPRFREIDLFIVPVSVLVLCLLYPQILLERGYCCWSYLSILVFLASLGLYYSLSQKMPGRSTAAFMVFVSLMILCLFSFTAGLEWASLASAGRSPADLFALVFIILGFAKSLGMLLVIMFMMVDYEKCFTFSNTPRRQLALATLAIVLICAASKFFAYPPLLTGLVMMELSRAVAI